LGLEETCVVGGRKDRPANHSTAELLNSRTSHRRDPFTWTLTQLTCLPLDKHTRESIHVNFFYFYIPVFVIIFGNNIYFLCILLSLYKFLKRNTEKIIKIGYFLEEIQLIFRDKGK